MCEHICECKQHCVYVALDSDRVPTPTHILAMILLILILKKIAKMNVKTRLLIAVSEYLFVSQVFKEKPF